MVEALIISGLSLVGGVAWVVARRSRARGQAGEIGSVTRGWADVRGQVAGQPSLRAPISGRPAMGYWVLIEQERGAAGWEPVLELTRLDAFDVDDGTGRITVRAAPDAVKLALAERRGKGGPFKSIPRSVAALLRTNRHSTHGVLFEKAFRWREQAIEPGQAVRVRGHVRADPSGVADATAYRQVKHSLAFVGGVEVLEV